MAARAQVRTRNRPPPRDARAEILDAALHVFARDGFAGASLSDIAARAGMGNPLVHYHFGSKERLWRAVVDYAYRDMNASYDAILQASRGLAPADVLRLLCRASLRAAARHPERIAIVLAESRARGPRFAWVVARHLEAIYARLDAVIAAAAGAGQIKPVPPAHLIALLVGAGSAFFGAPEMPRRFYGLDARDPATIDRHIDWVIEIVFDGIRLDREETP